MNSLIFIILLFIQFAMVISQPILTEQLLIDAQAHCPGKGFELGATVIEGAVCTEAGKVPPCPPFQAPGIQIPGKNNDGLPESAAGREVESLEACDSNAGRVCKYIMYCGFINAYAQGGVDKRVVTMVMQDPSSHEYHVMDPLQFRRWLREDHKDDAGGCEYDFIILGNTVTQMNEIRFSNRIVGHTSMMSSMEYRDVRSGELKMIYAGVLYRDRDGFIKSWSNSSGHFLPLKDFGNLVGIFWGMFQQGLKFKAKFDAKMFDERIEEGARASAAAERRALATKSRCAVGSSAAKKTNKRKSARVIYDNQYDGDILFGNENNETYRIYETLFLLLVTVGVILCILSAMAMVAVFLGAFVSKIATEEDEENVFIHTL